jgi:chaperonin GroES
MDMTKGRLLAGRILVLPDEPPTHAGKASKILLPDTAREKQRPRSGRVIAVAKEPHRFETGAAVPIEVKNGDHILYGRFGGQEWEDPDTKKTYLILAHNDVFMVLPE